MSYSVDGAVQFWNNWRLEGNLPEHAYYSIALLAKHRSLHGGHERGAVEQKTWPLSQYLSQSFDVAYQSCDGLSSLIFRRPRLFVAPSLGR